LLPTSIKDGKSKFQLGEGKDNPLQAWIGPEGFMSVKLPDFKTVGT